jgi:hypothetical protein
MLDQPLHGLKKNSTRKKKTLATFEYFFYV